MKPKILFIMHMPPPVHGAAIVGQHIHDSKLINDAFCCKYINPSASTKVAEVGKVSIRKIGFLLKLIKKIYSTIKHFKPDICYYTPTADGWGIYRDALTIQCMRWAGAKKIILHMHNKGVAAYSKKKLSHFAYKTIFRNNKVILLAKELRTDINQFVSDHQIVYCPNGMPETINETQFKHVIEKRTPIEDKAKILYLSNMMSEKGIWILLDACKMLKDDGFNFECNYVGNWGDTTYGEFCKYIKDYQLENYVKVNGPKYGKDKIPYLEGANMFIFPTYYHGETFGLVLLEAMEYAIPCISTFEGGIPSIITNGKNGLLVHQKSAKELYKGIMSLIQNPIEAERMGLNGRKHFKESFTLQSFEQRLKEILENYFTD